jgi:hypothetical protein
MPSLKEINSSKINRDLELGRVFMNINTCLEAGEDHSRQREQNAVNEAAL